MWWKIWESFSDNLYFYLFSSFCKGRGGGIFFTRHRHETGMKISILAERQVDIVNGTNSMQEFQS